MRKINAQDKICEACGGPFNRTLYPGGRLETPSEYLARRFCSHECYSDFHCGERHVSFVGGTVTIQGYVRSTDPDGSGRRGHLHRFIMEKKLGRRLEPNEHVHHRDGNALNNDTENLEVIGSSEHARLHSPHRDRNAKGQYA